MTKSKGNAKPVPKKLNSGRVTKKAQLIKLLGAKSGTDLKTLSDKLDWQPHTTRAAMSGLRKAGYAVICVKSAKGGASKYRIQAAPTALSVGTEASHAA
jgi:DNA-binding IclR family transcriptional regulator